MKKINLTPHTITFRTSKGDTAYPAHPRGPVRAVQADTKAPDVDGDPAVYRTYVQVEGLPDSEEGTVYILSMVAAAAAAEQGRDDVISPDTGPSAIRDQNGQIEAIIGWVRHRCPSR